VSRPVEERVDEDVIVSGIPPGAMPIIEEPQGGDTVIGKPLALKDPEHLRLPPGITSTLESSPEASSQPTELPASRAPVRMAQGRSRHSRKPNTLYIDGQ
jgi:hypothetical protein